MNHPIRIGLIGCGLAGEEHMNVYNRIKNANVVAVSDVIPEKAKILSKKYKIDKLFTDYMDLLEIKDLDLVDVCTPTSTHSFIVCEAAKSGHNILVEKPLARTTTECEKMISESRKKGVKLCVCHNQRFFSSIKKAKLIKSSKDILSLKTCSLQMGPKRGRWDTTSREGGMLWEIGVHQAYLQLHFLQKIEEIFAIGNKMKYSVYDNIKVLLRGENKSSGIMEMSWTSARPAHFCEIFDHYGGRMRIDMLYDSIQNESVSRDFHKSWFTASVLYAFDEEMQHFRKWMKYPLRLLLHKAHVTVYEGWGHFVLINEYLKALSEDTSPPVQPEEGKNAVTLLECIEESLNRKRVIQVKQQNHIIVGM